MNDSGTYSILHIPSNKRYVGSTKSFTSRKLQHEMSLNNGTHRNPEPQKAWRESAANEFEFYIIESQVRAEELINREQFWIDFFDCKNNGFNILDAGDVPVWAGRKRSKTKRKTRKQRQLKREEIASDNLAKYGIETVVRQTPWRELTNFIILF